MRDRAESREWRSLSFRPTPPTKGLTQPTRLGITFHLQLDANIILFLSPDSVLRPLYTTYILTIYSTVGMYIHMQSDQ